MLPGPDLRAIPFFSLGLEPLWAEPRSERLRFRGFAQPLHPRPPNVPNEISKARLDGSQRAATNDLTLLPIQFFQLANRLSLNECVTLR